MFCDHLIVVCEPIPYDSSAEAEITLNNLGVVLEATARAGTDSFSVWRAVHVLRTITTYLCRNGSLTQRRFEQVTS
jgi:hypothetical protein